MLGWQGLYQTCLECNRCPLGQNRKNMVFGEGNFQADLMFIGEAPGRDEDITGRPFVGRAGQLLDKALLALELTREEHYYIANICKCRPQNNRVPLEEEAQMCLPFLRNQFALIKPKIIVCLGATAMKYIIDREARISKIRGQWYQRKGIYIMATFHPAALLRDENKKRVFWEDLKKVKHKYVELTGNK